MLCCVLTWPHGPGFAKHRGAAVPAVLAYNHFLNLIKVISADMDSFALRLLNLIEREAERAR